MFQNSAKFCAILVLVGRDSIVISDNTFLNNDVAVYTFALNF